MASDWHERCPAECPFWAQNLADNEFCTFKCVQGSECSSGNPQMPIPDKSTGACSSPSVADCEVYHYDGTNRCKKCRPRYTLQADGVCYWNYTWLVWLVIAVFVVVFVLLLVWIFDLVLRPCTNPKILERCLRVRRKQVLCQPNDASGILRKWPLTTNLLRVNVAGPAIMLLFNFQAFLIIWALLVGALWIIFCLFHNDLFVLGTKPFGTPRNNCILVAWGHERQHALMWARVWFLSIVYLGTFVLCILFGIHQLHKFEKWSSENTGMRHFCAMCEGLPAIKGSDKGEEELKHAIEAKLKDRGNVKVVGVSICWDYKTDVEWVDDTLRERLHTVAYTNEISRKTPAANMGALRRSLFNAEVKIFRTMEHVKVYSDVEMRQMLGEMRSSENAFVVFHTKADRDAAVDATKKAGGFEYRGKRVKLKHVCAQPESVYWEHFRCGGNFSNTLLRSMAGCFRILLALFGWGVVFYAPYAWSIYTFSYANGAEPSTVYVLSFSLVVTLGNAILYAACSNVADWIGFHFRGHREAWYMVSYSIACMMQALLDMVTTLFMVRKIMEGLSFRTHDGTMLSNVYGVEFFASYAMQRTLAENVYVYAFPSTFLTPYVLEPFVMIVLPFLVGKAILRSHPELVGHKAEQYVGNLPLDLGRYADLHVNMFLAILVFFFPGGYTMNLFLGMVGSHAFIYMYDQWRVLRHIPTGGFVMRDADLWSQILLAPQCGLILSCLVFKGNCHGYGYCFEGEAIVWICSVAFVVHVLLHALLLRYFVPLFAKTEQDEKGETFREHATAFACNWFNANPVHCLRSELIYQDSPPCRLFVPGMEAALEKNERIGCHFSCQDVDDEVDDLQEFLALASGKDPWGAASESNSHIVKGGCPPPSPPLMHN